MFSKIFKVAVVSIGHVGGVRDARPVFLGVLVETLVVAGISKGRDNRAAVPTAEHVVPVDSVKEGVGLDAAGAAADVAEAPGAVDCAEGLDDVLGLV